MNAKEKADKLRAEADALEAAELKAERMKTAATIPTCHECGGRRFKIYAHTVVAQTLSYDDSDDDDGGDWEDDYESGDHGDQCDSAECAECGADAEAVLIAFGHEFFDLAPRPKPAPAVKS